MDGITFVCVNWGNYAGHGAQYVNILFDMVTRNLPEGKIRFQCFTDNAEGLDEHIEARELPADVPGWWNKLYLFKDGLFPAGERIFFLDLDTVITGPLDEIIKYSGEFAILRDFYHINRFGPGIMLWEAGKLTDIWTSYEAAGKPTDLPLGDLSWINKCFAEWNYKPDILQDVFPQLFCSYKVHARHGIPYDARVVSFHGFPRPHEAGVWVDAVWKIGGQARFCAESVMNTGEDEIAQNIRHSSSLDIPWLQTWDEHEHVACIVGGAPSLKGDLEEIRMRQKSGQAIFATNGTYRFLMDNGIIADYVVIIDARKENAAFLEGAKASSRFHLASQCAPETFEAVEGLPTTLMHMNYGARRVEDIIPKTDKTTTVIGGGNTVGLLAMSLAYTLGFRRIHLFGMDSSYSEQEHHAYAQDLNQNEKVLEVEAEGKKFLCAPWMIEQAQQFQELASALANAGCLIITHGSGLLPHIAMIMSTPQEQAA